MEGGNLQLLCDISGCSLPAARAALAKFPNDLNSAMNWVMDNPHATEEVPMPVTQPFPSHVTFQSVTGAPTFDPVVVTPAPELNPLAVASGPSSSEWPAETSTYHPPETPAGWDDMPEERPDLDPSTASTLKSMYFLHTTFWHVFLITNSLLEELQKQGVQIGPVTRLGSPPPSQPAPSYEYATDPDLQRALELSVQGNTQSNSAGWSGATGSWSNNASVSSSVSNIDANAVALRETEDEQMQRAMAESMMSSVSSLPPREGDEQLVGQTFEETLTPMDQVRALESGSPTVLRASTTHLPFLTALLQALYSLPAFRNTLLAMPLEQPSLDPDKRFTYQDYWKGKLAWPPGPPLGQEDEGAIALLKALQRLFLFMTFTRRKIINIQDVVTAFRQAPEPEKLTKPFASTKGM